MSLILVFFHSSKCGHSRRMDSIVDHYLRTNRGLLKVAKVDFDERKDLVQRFNATTTPTLILLENLVEVSRMEGRGTLPDIKAAFDTHLGPQAHDLAVDKAALATAG